MNHYLSLDLGGTYIKYGVLLEDGNILKKGIVGTERKSEHKFFDIVTDIYNSIDIELKGIAISMPGIIDVTKGIALTGGSLNFVNNTPLASKFEKYFKIPTTIANDGKCAVMAEHWLGSLSGYSSGIVIVFGSGIGGGIIVNNRLITGTHNAASEFSCMITNYKNPSIHNYWGANDSTKNLLRKYCIRRTLNIDKIDGYYFFEKLNEKEKEAVEVFEDFTTSVASGIYTLQSVLDVEIIALGGGISEQTIIVDSVRRALDKQFLEYKNFPVMKPKIVNCKFKNDANLIGALKFHLDKDKEGFDE